MTWRNGTNPPWRARFCAVRVTPAHDWRERRLAPEVWLLCERDLGATPRTKYYLVDLPATAPLRSLVALAHQRWAIEQQYQELKDETRPGSLRGPVVAGLGAPRRLDRARLRFLAARAPARQTQLTLPQVRAVVQEILTAHFFITHPHYCSGC